MKNKIIKKLVVIFMLLSIIMSTISHYSYALSQGDTAYLEEKGDCGKHLQYYNEERGGWYYITCTYVAYNDNGKEFPAYCINRELPGVGEYGSYNVSLTQVLEDSRIWRVISNGYPYKTSEEMGLENNYDAFVATKQAVYSILYDFDPISRYRGQDDRGTAIANSIVRLVDIGRNGTQSQYTSGISVNKIGNLKEEESYFSQEFNINSEINIENYSIQASNLPIGSNITDLNNIEKNLFENNSNFKIRIPKSSMNTDINVNFVINAKIKTYPVFYGSTLVDGTQNYAITCDSIQDVSCSGNLKLATNTGKLQINKIDSETHQPISGVVFQLSKKDGTKIATTTTDKNGFAEFSNLYQGDYILNEISTNEDYIIDKKNFEASIIYNKTTIIDISNEHKNGSLKIIKTDKKDPNIKLENVKFSLYSEELKKVIGTYTTNSKGEITINNLRTGKYQLKEVDTGSTTYYLNETTFKFEIINRKTTTISVENTPIEKPPVEEPPIEEPPVEEPPVEVPPEEDLPVIEIPKLPVTGM